MEMAILRFVAALILGIGGGLVALKIMDQEIRPQPSDENQSLTSSLTFKAFIKELAKQSRFILRIFFFSLFIAALTASIIPSGLVLKVLGNNSSTSVIIAVLAGIPLYACGGGAIPVLEVLYNLGMSKGAILAFFISGPATKFSTLAALFSCMEKKIIVLYLTVTILGAFLFGVAYNRF